ncbi:MAG: EamA family transporter RarD [Geminicoccaceae bacterium]
MAEQQDSRAGLIMAATAFTLWGVYPFYFKALGHVPPLEIVAHRILWSTLLLAPLIQARRAWQSVLAVLFDRQLRWGLAASTLLIASNWFAYVLAVTSGNVLDASLGYFLCPLVNVALGVAFLKERLSQRQTAAVALAAAAVLMLIVALGVVPKTALFLAISFGLYGLVRKRLPVDPATALFLECALLIPAGMAITLWLAAAGDLRTLDGDPWTLLLLMLSGFVTVVPLLLFGMGAKRLRLSTIGVLQYIAPSMLFIEGVLWFGEPLNPWRLAAFIMIWGALVIYSLEGVMAPRRAS